LGSRLQHGLVARFFLQHSGEKGVHQPCRGGELQVRGTGQLRVPPAAACPVPRLGWPRRRLRRCLLPFWLGRGCPSTARAMVAPCADLPHPRLLPRRQPHRGAVQDVVRRRGGGRVLGWSCPHSRSEDGNEDLFTRARAAAIRRYDTGARVAVVVGAEVVAAAGEAPHCKLVASAGETVSATYRRASDSLSLMASLSPPVGRRGRGPCRNGARAEVIAIVGESLVQRWSPLSVLRWSPPLASHSELAILRPYWCGGSSYLQSRDGTRAPLVKQM
jgi:hypothetical protein